MSREQLVGFMESLEGQWCGCSKRRKVVDADEIVKAFPINRKIELALRHRAGPPSLRCGNYVSPTGMQNKSCKQAAINLKDQSLIDVSSPSKQEDLRQMSQIKNVSHMFLKSEVTNSSLHDANNNNNFGGTNDLYDVEIASIIDCIPCGLTFEDMSGLEKHLANFHNKTTRRFNVPTHEATRLHILEKHAVMDHDEPQEAVSIINGNGNGNGNCSFKTKCTWCNKEFLCEAVDAETMAEASGFMCPKCKEKLCGVFDRSLSRSYRQ